MRTTASGDNFPLGYQVFADGVNFCLFAGNATSVELLLFDESDSLATEVLTLDPCKNRTGHYWHIFVSGLKQGQIYGYRVNGSGGERFHPEKLLLDPYAKAVSVPKHYDRSAGVGAGDNCRVAMKSVIADPSQYDWQGDHPLHRPFAETVIYEMHVGGFTKHESSAVAPELRGTYSGLCEKIPYLVDLGVTAVELLPVFQFDHQDGMGGLPNYWGYSPVSFFAPHLAYSSKGDPVAVINEFRDMVKALHRAGIEVILDVVYNHTAEGDHRGPTMCFRGLAESSYYMLDENRDYHNYSGTGNTLDPNSAVRRLIIDSLSYWVREMHVDGFRFDLASILARDGKGGVDQNSPLLWAIDSEPCLAGAKLIAEAWDAGGINQVGRFIGDRFTEWNGHFRDDVRSFLRGDRKSVSKFASRLLGSPDLYAHKDREPTQSINLITCHDGFTLNDLVTYNKKYNDANREGNRDGHNHNLSWNCGVEGPTDDPEVNKLRLRQIKNFLTVTLLSLGTPMILMGDEMRRTQHGNNNAWCQNNETSWLDWSCLEKNADIHRFVKLLLEFRKKRDITQLDQQEALLEILGRAAISWHGLQLNKPDWGDDSHSIALTVESLSGSYMMHIMINAWRETLCFELPDLSDKKNFSPWLHLINTYLPSPDDICDFKSLNAISSDKLNVEAHSIVVALSLTTKMLTK